MERKVQVETSQAAKRKDNRYKEEKHTLRAQMAVDDTKRHMLDDLKAQEKQREEVVTLVSVPRPTWISC